MRRSIKNIFIIFVFLTIQSKCFSLQNEEEKNKSIQELEITDQDKINIYELVKAMSKINPFLLVFQKKNLEKLRDDVYDVHPLRLLDYIFSEQILIQSVRQIKKSYFKWKPFSIGFSEKMIELNNENEVKKYIKSFSQELNIDESIIQKYVKRNDWEKFLKYLVTIKT